MLPCNREPERTHDVSGRQTAISTRLWQSQSQTMGGRRSRHWGGPGRPCGADARSPYRRTSRPAWLRPTSRETNLAAVRRFTGQWSAPTFLKRKGKRNEGTRTKNKENKAREAQNGFVFESLRATRGTQPGPAASGTPELSSMTHNPQPPVCQTRDRSRVRSAKTKTRPGNTIQSE
jgi:hypothetical protein